MGEAQSRKHERTAENCDKREGQSKQTPKSDQRETGGEDHPSCSQLARCKRKLFEEIAEFGRLRGTSGTAKMTLIRKILVFED
jgi:hypothetical protein